MACPNTNTDYFRELEKDFGYDDAYRINFRTNKQKFDRWYGDGKRDKFGNPVTSGNYFISGTGQKFLIANALRTTEEERSLWKLGARLGWEGHNDSTTSELSKAQWVHVRTKAFKDWFGDWQNFPQYASKALNKLTGEPQVYYHQGNKIFSTERTTDTPVFVKTETALKEKAVIREDSNIKSAVSNDGNYTVGINNINKSKLKLSNKEFIETTETKSELLKARFASLGIEVNVVENEDLQENANVEVAADGSVTITINPNKVYADTIPHEFSHLYVDLLGYNNPLVKGAIKQLKEKSPQLWNLVQNRYAEDNLTQEELEKELLVTAMGVEGAALMEQYPEGISTWKATMNRIFRAIGNLLGVKPNIAKQLFADILFNEFRISEFKGTLEEGVQKSKIEDIANVSAHIMLDSTDPDNTFYKDTKNSSKLERLTEVVSGEESPFSFVKNGEKIKYEEIRAANAFNRHGKDKSETVTYVIKGKQVEFTFEELKNFYDIKNKTSTAAGSVAHAMIEKYIKIRNNQSTMDVDKRINELSKEKPGKQEAIPESWFNWLEPAIPNIFGKLGINIFDDSIDVDSRDKVRAEVILHSDLMGVGTTADTIVEHIDGTVSMIDWKAGTQFLADSAFTSRILKYSGNEYIDMFDNKLGRAQLELMARAMIVKEHNPDTKFRNLTVAHISKNKEVEGFEVNINAALGILENYYKAEKPEVYKQLKEKGVFDKRSYAGMDMDMKYDEELAAMSHTDRLNTYKRRLQALTTQYPKNKHNDDEIVELTKKILVLEKDPGESFDFSMTGELDMNIIKRWIGSKTAVTNNIVQSFIKKIVEPAQKSAQEELDEVREEHRELLIKVADEYFQRKGLGKKSERWLKDNLQSFFMNYNDMYSFMWEYVDSPGKTGWYARTDMESLVKDTRNPEGRPLTKAEKEYSIWYRDKIASMYKTTMSMVGDADGKTVAQVLGKESELNPDFLPRVPMTLEEVAEAKTLVKDGVITKESASDRTGRLGKEYWKYLWNNKITTNTTDAYQQNVGNAGLPVKYLGSEKIIESGNHTLNTEIMFENFASNMIMKKHLDPAYAVGQGVVGYFNSSEMVDPVTGEQKFPKMTAWLKDQLQIQLQTVEGKEQFSRKGFRIVDRKTGKVTQVNVFGLMRMMKTLVSASALWLKPIGGAVNGTLITTLNVKNAIKGDIAKTFMGVDDSSIDFTLSDLIFAHGEVGKHWAKTFAGGAGGLAVGATAGFFTGGPLGAVIGGAVGTIASTAIGTTVSEENASMKHDKLNLLMEKYRFLPDNYDYAVKKGSLITGKNKIVDQGHMYLFHSIPEEYGQQVLFIAMMKRMKINPSDPKSKSVWDSYEVNAKGELEWTGGTRFRRILSSGEIVDVTELTSEEINRMKYVSARIHGGYRTEEKTALELTAIGTWGLQFKKYLPAIIIDSMQGKFEDMSIGKFQEFKQQDGQTVYEWAAVANRGRMWVVASYLKTMFGVRDGSLKEYSQSLSTEEQKHLSDFIASAGMWIFLFFVVGMAFGDDDDEIFGIPITQAFKDRYYKYAQDMTQGFNPLDWAKAMEKPFAVVPKFYQTTTALTDLLLRGVFKGERVKTGKYKGNLPGEAVLEHNVPVFSSSWELEKYFNEFAETRK